MKDISLKQRVGEEVTHFFIIRDIDVRTKKSDNMPYAVLELGYRHGRIWANVWENTESFLAEYATGDIIKVRGMIEQYRDQTQIRIKKIRKSVETDNVKPEDLLPVYPGDYDALKKELPNVIRRIENPHLRGLCTTLLLESDFGEKFCTSAAGKLWHHGYVGGLLEHTLILVQICEAVALHYPMVNIDLLRTGALFHDIGKVDSYTATPYIDYTDSGRLIGHIVLGYDRVGAAIKKIDGFPEDLARELLHLILSHQGELEKASPVVPMTLEAVILHHADELDAQVNAFQRIINEQKTSRKKWSNYVNLIDRFIYFGGLNNTDK